MTRYGTAIVTTLLLGVGCGEGIEGGVTSGSEADDSLVEVAPDKNASPDELEIDGRRYVRTDLVDTAEMQALQDPNYFDPGSVDELAHGLREFADTPHGSYVEAEPNFDLALRIMASNEDPSQLQTTGAPPRENRVILDSDGRSLVGDPELHSAVGRQIKPGCSGTLIGPSLLYTAAHCLFDNRTDDDNGTGWLCADGTRDNDGNACDDPGEAGDPKWTFPHAGTVQCGYSRHVHSHWKNNQNDVKADPETEADYWQRARYDYGKVKFYCTPGYDNGFKGVAIAPDPTIYHYGQTLGYPSRLNCPDGSHGTSADCPDGTRLNGDMVTQWTLYREGDGKPSRTWRLLGDITGGQSGGPIIDVIDGDPAKRVVGVVVNGSGGKNKANRLDATVYNYLFN